MAVNMFIISRSLRPLNSLLSWIDSLKLGVAVPPLDNDTKVYEFRRLNEAMMQNAERNHRMYEEQNIFIGNASHELQTPIAICRNRLEMLADDQSLSEAQLGEILSVMGTLDKMSRMNRTLLMLTKIDNGQYPDKTTVNVNDLIREIIGNYEDIYAGKGVTVNITERGTMRLQMNDTLATVMFHNLIKNAYVHSATGASIEITISPSAFTIANDALQGALDKDRIFRRFYHSGDSESSGLGLPLIDSICRLYGMKITYSYVSGKHLFRVDTK
jgi:signal transduction histidine kinase